MHEHSESRLVPPSVRGKQQRERRAVLGQLRDGVCRGDGSPNDHRNLVGSQERGDDMWDLATPSQEGRRELTACFAAIGRGLALARSMEVRC